MGNASLGIPLFQMTPWVAPLAIFGQYILISLPKHYFTGWFEKCVHRNLRN